jgi:heterodisulfide reductase subunit B
MKFALFQGCNIPARVEQYADATIAVSRKLGIDLVDIAEFNCCGYPARNTDFGAFVLSAAKNLAVAQKAGLDMLVMCKCCYGSLKKVEHILHQDQELKTEINGFLAKENLEYQNGECITKVYSGLQIAVSYGCHALRPSKVTAFDDPVSPKIFDELVEITGAYSVDWSRKLDCCGAPLTGINDQLAMEMAQKKIASAKEASANFICTACPYTQLQFDKIQAYWSAGADDTERLAPILYPQLLGLSMGIDEKILGIAENEIDLSGITSFLMAE